MSNEELSAGTFLIGPLGTIEDVDDGACALLGYQKEELVGLHGSELIPPERRPGVAVTLDRMRQGGVTFVEQGLIARKSGDLLSVAVTARRLGDGRLMLSLHPTNTVS